METKTIRLGKTEIYEGKLVNVFCKIENKKGNLAISGVEGPYRSGGCSGACGQIEMHVEPENYIREYAPGWNLRKVKKFFQVWREWHLNDMQSACEHQRNLGWTYEEHSDPKTFKGEACPTCGYEIGSAWLTKEVPQAIWDFLFSLPDTDKYPAWV